MSTVLWANYLLDGHVTCDQADKYALYKHAEKLDEISRKLGVVPFIDIQDTTDAQVNLQGKDLPDGMTSTDELMARDGLWVDANEVISALTALLTDIRANDVRFGLLSNDQADVIEELEESLEFAKQAAEHSAKFNFSVVM